MTSLPKNFGAAFDLSLLKNSSLNEKPAGVAITKENLMSEALPASHEQVVVLICWSPRSPQSQSVMTALGLLHEEDLSKVKAGTGTQAWILGNVNVDVEPEVAQALQVQTVPLALAIIQEQIVPLFETVPTAAQLRLVIDKVCALASERGIGGQVNPALANDPANVEVEEKLEPEEAKALDALESGDFAGAKEAYKQWLNRDPRNSLALLGLAQVELLERINGVDADSAIAAANENPLDNKLVTLAADCEFAFGNIEAAFSRLINAIRAASSENRAVLREHLVGLFALVEPTDPILVRARQQLASALF